MSDATSILIWWSLLQAMGLTALPLVFRLLRWLPDRGYSVAKPAGMLLGNYLLWALGSLGWLRNTGGGILLAFGLVALLSVWVYRRWDDGPKLTAWLRAHVGWVIAYEAVFLIALAAWALFRAHNPDLSTTEKSMEFAFMNGIARSTTFPPSDPWLSGFGISYYYFGYVMMSTLMKTSAVNPGVAFSLSNALWFALTAAGAFGIAANLAAASKRATTAAIVATGLLGALFVPALGNFEGPLEVAHSNAIGSPEFWSWLDIKELNKPPAPEKPGEVRWPFCDANGCPAHPRASQGWWWWRASRVVHDYPLDRSNPELDQELIDEFPFFSFLLGDMHPHVLALPYALMSIALAFNLFRMGSASGATSGDVSYRNGWRGWFWDAAPIALTYPVFLGALSFLNTWDFPIHVFIVALAWGVGRWSSHPAARAETSSRDSSARPATGSNLSIWGDAFIALVLCGVLGAVAYLPFYFGLRSQVAGIAPNIYNPTRLPQFFVVFGPFLLIGTALIVTLLVRAVQQRRVSAGRALLATFGDGAAIVIGSALVTASATVVILSLSEGTRAKLDEVSSILAAQGISLGQALVERLSDFSVPLFLGVVLAAIALILRSRLAAAREDDEPGAPFALVLFAVGALLTFAVEYVYLLDQFGYRMNTVFKLYYQAWALWGVASAYAVYHLWASRERLRNVAGRLALGGVLAVSLAGGLVYPLLAIQSGTVGRPLREMIDAQTGERIIAPIDPTLDARAPTERFAPDEVAAIDWLAQNASPDSVVLEAPGQGFQDYTSRLSGWSGVPTVVGWVGHEGQWRGAYDDISPRVTDVDLIYSTIDKVKVFDLLRKYRVEFVYVGPNERAKYPPEGLAKFGAIMSVAFEQGGATIYRVPRSIITSAQ